ncbi:MAG: heavy-metal-associated domain-containing protein [Clostridiales bacterium]|nr:heavy-metal-associated domain-containing protein [Clostridiales bacterium]
MKYRIKTEGMGCPHCIARVNKAVTDLGAVVIRMELNDFTIECEADPGLIRSTIADLGFDVISVEEE